MADSSFNIADLPLDDDELVSGITQHAEFAEDVGGATPIDRVISSSGPRPDKTLTAATVAGLNSFNTAYAGRYKAGLFGRSAATRGKGDLGNHSAGKAYDLAIVDLQTGKTLTNYVGYDGKGGFQGTTKDNLGIYQELAGKIFSSYVAFGGDPAAFRWGGDFSKSDPMHVDLNGLTRAKSFVQVNPELAKQLQEEARTFATSVQERLRSIGHDIEVDGVLGPKTLTALSQVQHSEEWAAGFPELAAKRHEGLPSQEIAQAGVPRQSFEETFRRAELASRAAPQPQTLKDALALDQRITGDDIARMFSGARPGRSQGHPFTKENLAAAVERFNRFEAEADRKTFRAGELASRAAKQPASRAQQIAQQMAAFRNGEAASRAARQPISPRTAQLANDMATFIAGDRASRASPQPASRAAEVARQMGIFRSGEMASRAAPQPVSRAAQLAQQMATFLSGEKASRAAPQPASRASQIARDMATFRAAELASRPAPAASARRSAAPVSFRAAQEVGLRPSPRAAQDLAIDEGITLRNAILSARRPAQVRVSGPGRKPTIIGATALKQNLMKTPVPRANAQEQLEARRAIPSPFEDFLALFTNAARNRDLAKQNQVAQQTAAASAARAAQQRQAQQRQAAVVARAAPAPVRAVSSSVDSQGIRTVVNSAGVSTRSGFHGIPDLQVSSRGGGGDGGGGTFLCTLVYELGGMSEELIELDRKFADTVSPAVRAGYGLWARPLAGWLRGRQALHGPVIWLVGHWARHMAHVMLPCKYPRAPFGAAMHFVGAAVCGMLGRFAQAAARRDLHGPAIDG